MYVDWSLMYASIEADSKLYKDSSVDAVSHRHCKIAAFVASIKDTFDKDKFRDLFRMMMLTLTQALDSGAGNAQLVDSVSCGGAQLFLRCFGLIWLLWSGKNAHASHCFSSNCRMLLKGCY
nr:hypothetical protein [Tanacetum cinerariifolium]